MDTWKYEAMVLSVELGSFTRAAERLDYTQSGLTHMMNALEADVGFRLLERGHFGIRLTKEGALLMPAIKNFLKSADDLNEEIRVIREQAGAVITIGAYSSIAKHWLPTILDAFSKDHPSVEIKVLDESRDSLFSGVQSGRLDLAFTSEPRGEAVDWAPLYADTLMALLPKSAIAQDAAGFHVEDFDAIRFLMPGFGYEADICAVLDAHDVHPEIVPTDSSDAAIISMVAHGLGVSMLSALCLKGYEEGVRAMPLLPGHSRTLGIITRKGEIMNPVVASFIECATATVAQMYAK